MFNMRSVINIYPHLAFLSVKKAQYVNIKNKNLYGLQLFVIVAALQVSKHRKAAI
jgi:hypothetical protein